MEKEKCLVPSVISLHVRAIDQNEKDSLKNLLNTPETSSSRKFSYNLVRIYNTGYSINRSKPANDNLPPYLSNVNSKSHILSTALINSRFNALLKKTNTEYSSLYPNCRLPNSNHFWSNSIKTNQNNASPVFDQITSRTLETDSYKSQNALINTASFNSSSINNELTANKSTNNIYRKKSNVILKSDVVHEIVQISDFYPESNKSKAVDTISKIPPITVRNSPLSSQIEAISNKSPPKKLTASIEKVVPKRSTSSFLLPIKERPTTSFDLLALSPVRSQTVVTKVFNSTHKQVPSLSNINGIDSKKFQPNTNEASPKINQPCLFSRLNHSQSLFISNNQPFLYPDPCDNDSSISFMSRLGELTAYVSETVRWEKSRISRRRCRPQTETI